MAFSRKTQMRLAEAMDPAFTHASLNGLFYEFGVEGRDPGPMNNKLARATAMVRAIVANPDEAAADENLRELIDRTLQSELIRQQHPRLIAALAADGYEWGDGRLVPAMPAPAPVAGEVTVLETELTAQGFDVAQRHYRQAVDNFADGNFEASNGMLRSFLESAIKVSAARAGLAQEAGPDACLQYLRRDAAILDDNEWNWFRALWAGVQTNGAHAGLTSEEEARFRIHTATAAVRYLLKKIAANEN